MRIKLILAGLAVAACMFGARLYAVADEQTKGPGAFSVLETMPTDAVRAKCLAWLKTATNNDAAKLQAFDVIWGRQDRTILDNVADTFALGSPAAQAALVETREAIKVSTKVPAVLKDTKAEPFFRANLGLVVARLLSQRMAHEEALEIFNAIDPNQTIDPATYLFYRARCEHALLKKDDAIQTIDRLRRYVFDAPRRYQEVVALMHLDMQTWRKDLSNVARLMDNSGRRLDLDRTDDGTKKVQKEIIARLDELIKELENQQKQQQGSGGGGGAPGGSCPDGTPGDGSGNQPSTQPGPPKKGLDDFGIGGQQGSGKTDFSQIKKIVDGWSKLPPLEQQRAKAQIDELISTLAPIHREAFERYFEEINSRIGTLPKR